jgi:ferritin-like metal-binding protein YciE
MTDREEHLLAWLRDAHAMEEQFETILESQIGRLKHYPALKQKLQEHLVETRSQAKRVKACIQSWDEKTSTLKQLTAKTIAVAQGLSGLFVDDEVIKGCLAMYTFKHMEIASYQILIAAAETIGDSKTAATCLTIMQEEEAMAAWLDDEIPGIVSKFLKRDEIAGVEAKR